MRRGGNKQNEEKREREGEPEGEAREEGERSTSIPDTRADIKRRDFLTPPCRNTRASKRRKLNSTLS